MKGTSLTKSNRIRFFHLFSMILQMKISDLNEYVSFGIKYTNQHSIYINGIFFRSLEDIQHFIYIHISSNLLEV